MEKKTFKQRIKEKPSLKQDVYKRQVLATRTANKENNFKATAAITLLPTQKGIYIKQTDPRGCLLYTSRCV